MKNRIFKSTLFAVAGLFLVLGVSSKSGQAQSNSKNITTAKLTEGWKFDSENSDFEKNINHYTLEGYDDIDLIVSECDSNLLFDVRKKKDKEIFSEIERGKNFANSLVSKVPLKLFDSSRTSEAAAEVLKFKTRYELLGEEIQTQHIYYLSAEGSFQVTLKWRPSADAAAIERAKNLFSQIQFTPVGTDKL